MAYKVKIKHIKDIKLLEFNYKVLNNILPCNVNLKMWRIKDSDECPTCGDAHNIVHMLYDCVGAQRIWSLVHAATGYQITPQTIILHY